MRNQQGPPPVLRAPAAAAGRQRLRRAPLPPRRPPRHPRPGPPVNSPQNTHVPPVLYYVRKLRGSILSLVGRILFVSNFIGFFCLPYSSPQDLLGLLHSVPVQTPEGGIQSVRGFFIREGGWVTSSQVVVGGGYPADHPHQGMLGGTGFRGDAGAKATRTSREVPGAKLSVFFCLTRTGRKSGGGSAKQNNAPIAKNGDSPAAKKMFQREESDKEE